VKHFFIIGIGAAAAYGIGIVMLLETHANGLTSWYSIPWRIPIWAGQHFASAGEQINSGAFHAVWISECIATGILLDLTIRVLSRDKLIPTAPNRSKDPTP
jgi:hypothetical protein